MLTIHNIYKGLYDVDIVTTNNRYKIYNVVKYEDRYAIVLRNLKDKREYLHLSLDRNKNSEHINHYELTIAGSKNTVLLLISAIEDKSKFLEWVKELVENNK